MSRPTPGIETFFYYKFYKNLSFQNKIFSMQGNSNDDSLTIILNNASNVRPCDRATSGLSNSHEFAVPKPKPRPPAAKQPQQPEWIERSLSFDGLSIVERDISLEEGVAPGTALRSLYVGNARSSLGILLKSIADHHDNLKKIYEKLTAIQEKTAKVRVRKCELLGKRQQLAYCEPTATATTATVTVATKLPVWVLLRREDIYSRDQMTWEAISGALQKLSKPEKAEKYLRQASKLVPQLCELPGCLGSVLLSKLIVYQVEKIFLTNVASVPLRAEVIESLPVVKELEEMRAFVDRCNAESKDLRSDAAKISIELRQMHDQLSESAKKSGGHNVFVTATHRISKPTSVSQMPVPEATVSVDDAQKLIATALETQHKALYKKQMTVELTTARMLCAGNFLAHVRDGCFDALENSRKQKLSSAKWIVSIN
jgi:hypothetical protein